MDNLLYKESWEGMMYKVTVLLLSLAFAVGRVVLPAPGLDGGDVFKDLAHLWVGGLIGLWAGGRWVWNQSVRQPTTTCRSLVLEDRIDRKAKMAGWAALLLILIEIAMAAMSLLAEDAVRVGAAGL